MTTALKSIPLSRAAQALGVAWPKAWAMMLKGELRAEQIGGRWFVDPDSLASAQAARSEGAAGDRSAATESVA
ncbi:MAG: hypothetical protein ACR2G6_05830 [Gemmatimonadaceae bacterium]